MKIKLVYLIIIQLTFITTCYYAQNYVAEYNKLASPLFEGEAPVICILEEGSSLFDALSKYPDFASKFTCYSSEVIAGLKDALQVEEFNPEDQKFQQALKEQLSVGYILSWKAVPDSDGVYLLDIYSTENNSKITSKRFIPSTNSNSFEDAKKLVVDNMETIYSLPAGEIEVTAVPETAHFKLIKGDEVIKEWTGSEKIQADAGKYKLLSEADKYASEESDLEVTAGQTTSITINLKPQYSSMISVKPADGKITNIRSDVDEERVKVTYDLITKNTADIALLLTDKKTALTKPLKMISGDFEGVKPGKDKMIFWDMKKELGGSPVNEYEIKISAKEAGGIAWYYYAGGGAALLGGAAVLLMGGGGDNGTNNPPAGTKIGLPPGRP